MRFAALFVAALFAASCSNAGGPKPIETASSPTAATQKGPAPEKSGPAMPGSGAMSPDAPDQPMDEKVVEARAAYDKNPSDAAAKKALIEVTLQNAQFYMYKSPLPPNQKYRKALHDYREVLKLDPSNAKASDSIAMIESIYKSMNKPVPEV
jgi:hypothetical protein